MAADRIEHPTRHCDSQVIFKLDHDRRFLPPGVLGGCDGEGEVQEIFADESDDSQPLAAMPTRGLMSGRSDEEIQTCKKHYRDSIDEIDAEMRSGYSSEQGEVFRQRLRQLTKKLRAC